MTRTLDISARRTARALAFRKGQAERALDPRQAFAASIQGHGACRCQPAIKPLPLTAVSHRPERYTRVSPIRSATNGAFTQLDARGLDSAHMRGHLEQLLGQSNQFSPVASRSALRRSPRSAHTIPHERGSSRGLDAELLRDGVGGLEPDAADSRASRYGFSVMTTDASAP